MGSHQSCNYKRKSKLTPSLPQLYFRVEMCAHRPVRTTLLSLLCVLVEILSRANAKKEKGLRNSNFALLLVVFKIPRGSERVKSLNYVLRTKSNASRLNGGWHRTKSNASRLKGGRHFSGHKPVLGIPRVQLWPQRAVWSPALFAGSSQSVITTCCGGKYRQ